MRFVIGGLLCGGSKGLVDAAVNVLAETSPAARMEDAEVDPPPPSEGGCCVSILLVGRWVACSMSVMMLSSRCDQAQVDVKGCIWNMRVKDADEEAQSV